MFYIVKRVKLMDIRIKQVVQQKQAKNIKQYSQSITGIVYKS